MAAPPPIDRTAEYLDAIVADSMDGLGEDLRPIVSCVSEAILVAVGGAAGLDAAGVSPQLFGVADDLTELGIPIDPGAEGSIAAAAESCGLGAVVATQLVGGFAEVLRQVGSAIAGTELPQVVDDADQACLIDQVGAGSVLPQGFAAGYVRGDDIAADQAFASAFSGGLGSCPHTFVPYFITVARASGLAPTGDAEACIEAEVTARADRLATAFVGGDVDDAQRASIEVFETCQAALGSG